MTRRPQVHSVDLPEDDELLESPEEAIGSGVLAIPNANEASPQSELWERPASDPVTLPTDGSSVLRFHIQQARIYPPSNEDLKVKRYVVYKLVVHLDGGPAAVIDPQPATIERRYTDFRNLYMALKRNQPIAMASVDFPNRVLMGNFSPDVVTERSTAFEVLLMHVASNSELRASPDFLSFLQENELERACQLLQERRYESAVPLLEDSFRLLNKIYMDRSKPVLLMLCRLVAACTASPVPHHAAETWASLALSRYECVCDIDMLVLYIPLLHTCAHLWWKRGRDQQLITRRLDEMHKKGIPTKGGDTLMCALEKLDPR